MTVYKCFGKYGKTRRNFILNIEENSFSRANKGIFKINSKLSFSHHIWYTAEITPILKSDFFEIQPEVAGSVRGGRIFTRDHSAWWFDTLWYKKIFDFMIFDDFISKESQALYFETVRYRFEWVLRCVKNHFSNIFHVISSCYWDHCSWSWSTSSCCCPFFHAIDLFFMWLIFSSDWWLKMAPCS